MSHDLTRLLPPENWDDGYYHFSLELDEHPDALCYVIFSMRGPGKTYSFLRYCAATGKKFIYMKRTNDDVKLICTYKPNSVIKKDPSPFAPINRDFKTNIRPVLLEKGIGAFYDDDDPDEDKEALGYILSLNKVKSVKGVDFSECAFICFDEFIPQTHEIVRRTEGSAVMDFLMTCQRDREYRGLDPVRLVLFANSENIATPITHELEIMDDMAMLVHNPNGKLYIPERGILLHHIKVDECPAAKFQAEESAVSKLMGGTAWARKALYGDFVNNDFSNVCRQSVKRMTCIHKIHYRNKIIYVYLRESDGLYYFTYKRNDHFIFEWDLNKENDQHKFWIDHAQELQYDCIDGNVAFEEYSMYDLLTRYKDIFKV